MNDPKPSLRPMTPSDTNLAPVVTSDRFTRLEAELATRSRMQTAVAELGQASLTRIDSQLLIAQACGLILDTLAVDFCRALEFSPEHARLETRAFVGAKGIDVFEESDSVADYAYAAAEPVAFDDLSTETRFDGGPFLSRLGVTSGLSVPLPGSDIGVGVVGVFSRARREFQPYEIEFVQSIASVLSAAIESRRRRDALEASRNEIRRRERLGGVGSWSWTRGTRKWQWSPQIYRMLELPDDTALSYDEFLRYVSADDRAAFEAMINAATEKEGEEVLQHRIITEEGEVRVVHTIVQSIFGNSDTPLRLVGTTQDITRSTQAAQNETRLATLIELAAEEWRMTCDAINALVVVVDSNATMLRLNDRASRILRMSFEEALGRPMPSPSIGEPWSTMRQMATVVRETGVNATVQTHDSVRDKSWEITARAMSAAGGDERVVLVAYDVTDQAARERIRREADVLDAVTSLIHSISSRTNVPLATLGDLLATQLDSVELSSSDLRSARAAAHDLTRLFRELEEYARPFDLPGAPSRIEPVLQRAARTVAPLAARRNVRLILNENDSAGGILINDARLERLFTDLFTLFVERSSEDATIQVTVSTTPWRREEWVGVMITTSRPIFSRAELHWSLDSALPHLDGDDGIRLSICQRIVDEHGGAMLMVNRPDEGTSFVSLRFPPLRGA